MRWGTPPQVFFNFGGQFSSASSNYPTNTGGLQRKTIADNGVPFTWELDGDVIDLDGDGIGESVYFDSGGFKRFVRAVPADGAPPRLLQAIHNGRGGHALVTYAQMHDGSAVVQDPAATWFDGRPKATPRTQWVVKAVRNTDDFAGTDSTTSYLYLHPRHGADDEGRFAFRGFEEVWTTSPSLMKTVQRYDYAGDWSGRLAQVLVVPGEAASEVRSISKTKWTGRALFNFAVTSYFPTAVETWTCATGQNEAACLAAPAGYTVSESTLTDFPLIGDKRLILETGSKLSNANVDNDRQTIRTFTMLVDATSYLVRPVSTTKEHRVAGTMVMYAKSAQEWEPTLKAPTTEETWFDSNDANRAKTSLVFDLTTGNLLERRKPVQNDAGTSSAIFEYDSRKLFVAKETNELGHVRDFQWEYGTGTKLQTDGPDIRTCTACDPPTPDQPLKEQTKIRVDGLGRTIERWDTNSEDGGSFVLYQRELTSYVDNATPTIPASTTHQVRKTTSIASSWTNVKTELDGHGRPLRTIQLAQGTAPADAITSYAYANDGTLQSVSVPDPTQNNASTVTYRYTFDSLGRAISIRRPDSITVANQSGVDITYNGVTKTVREVTGVAGGLAAATKTVTDSFGRLVEVHEKYAGPGNGQSEQFAITHYTYGPDDNVIAVVDPQSVTTQLQHDFAGRRTQIVRHGRTWKYTYDKNGNLISEQVPGSPNPPVTDPDYTTTIVYDALDRPVSKLVGARGMSATDQTLFAGRSETFQWDYGGNMKGHLRYWTSYAPNASTPTLKREMRRTDLDLGSTDKVSFFGLAGLTTSHQTLARYNLAGLPSSTHHYDQVAPSNHNTVSTIQYDANLRPTKIDFNNINSGQPVHALAVQTRNVAGLVTKRRTVFVPGTADYVESNWTYDTLGRITDQLVQTTPGPVQVARQTLTYLGNDNPSTLGHTIGASAKSFQYGYDFRHQITSAAETTTPGYFTSAYVYGPAGRFTGTNIAQTNPAPGSELIPRNVAYQYADPDPERVTALLLAGGSTRFASYQYDEAGNMTSRCYGASAAPCVGESVEFLYDGKDQLRRATKKLNGVVQGSEEYWYDHEGSRVAIVKRDASGTKTETIVFRGDVEAHYDSANTLDFVYTHVSLGTPVARLKRTNTGIELEHQFHGLANHTLVAVSSAGTINSAFSYTPFGEVVETVDAGNGEGAAAHPRRFNDKYQDAISALAYYGARCFDRTLIGWSQSDPLYSRVPDAALHGNPRRANQYQFSLSNPLMYLDPDGLDSFGGTGNVGSYRSEMESSTRGWAANTSSDLVDTQSCEYSSSRCPPRWTLFADLNQKKSAEAKQIPIPEFAPEDSDVRFAPPGWEKDLRCSTPDQCKLAKRIGVAWLVLLTPVVVATIPAMVRGASATRVGPVATTVLDTNRIHHIFGQARHNLDPLVARFGGSREAAYTAVESATQTVVRSQRLSGVFETAVRVADFNVVVRGRVMDNVARISTFFIP